MIGALWTGISGLSSQQQALDNESNNIANVNTIGFKSSRISFADQMYQDRIGKGSKILDAEKLYVQGNLKLTGVSYDMALSGEGFFSVVNTRTSGTSEVLYTRAGNFRMGDNGTLQDSAGNEVQGWMMSPIDTANDVVSTNPNVTVFTNDYSKLLNSKVIRHNTYVETITAKATDYTQTAKSDSETVFSGAGMKTKAAKISDVEAAIADYSSWLQKLKDTPDGASSTSIAQVSQINFKTGDDGLVSRDGDQIYVYIDGTKISQNYVPSTADQAAMDAIYAYDQSLPATDQVGYADPADASNPLTTAEQEKYNVAVSRIETYKALADKISAIPGLVAYMAKESDTVGVNNDVLQLSENFDLSTNIGDMYKGIIEIKSLIPGEEFVISEVAEVSGSSSIQGHFQTQTIAQAGQGTGALETSRDALARLITGKQQDVYTSIDLNLNKSPMFNFSISIYDKELAKTIPIPNDGGTPPSQIPVLIDATNSDGNFTIDAFVENFNLQSQNYSPKLTDYIEVLNLNGNLVIQTLDKNYDVEFTPSIKQLPTYTVNLNEIVDNSLYTFNLDINGTTYPIQIDYTATNSLDNATQQQYIRDVIETEINNINASNPTYQLGITEQNNGVFSVYTKNEDINFINSNENVIDSIPNVSSLNINTLGTPSIQFEKDTITIDEPLSNIIYTIDIMGQTFTYDNTFGSATSANDITSSIKAQIETSSISSYLSVSNNINSMGSVDEGGVVLTNGLTNLEYYDSNSSGIFMISIPSGTTDLTLYLNESTYDDTFQVFTKSGKHIAGTSIDNASWTSGYSPSNIVSSNLGTYFDSNAVYLNELSSPSIANTYYGPYNSSNGWTNSPSSNVSATYIDKNGNIQTINISEHEELVVIPSVSEDLVVFVNTSTGEGAYWVAAEWGNSGAVTSGSSSLVLKQTALQNPFSPTGLSISNLNGVIDDDITDFDYTSRVEHRFTINTDDTKSAAIYTLNISGREFEIKTDQTPTLNEILTAFNTELANDSEWNEKYVLSIDGNDLVIQDVDGEYGYTGFSQNSTLNIRSLTYPNDEYKTVISSTATVLPLDKNSNYSGRQGAGAEFLEIVNKVDQTASKGSLQLRLDTLGISNSAFGEFAVDSSGLITMKQDGAEFAIGQVAIALFNNNRGLEPVGDNLLSKTNESGESIYNLNNDKTAKVESQTLELSTADLSESLVNLMVFQRAFEANAKSITTSDELLNTLINLKR